MNAATNELSLLYSYLTVGGLLFALGLVGFLIRRNMIVVFLCAEVMLQGVSLSLVAFGRYHGALVQSTLVQNTLVQNTLVQNDSAIAGAWGGQMLVLFIITIAACEAAIAMALILMLARQSGKLDTAAWQDLREEGQPAFIDREVPEERTDDHVWPKLTPAGIRPLTMPEDELYRPRI